jgi:hypothetical protein
MEFLSEIWEVATLGLDENRIYIDGEPWMVKYRSDTVSRIKSIKFSNNHILPLSSGFLF